MKTYRILVAICTLQLFISIGYAREPIPPAAAKEYLKSVGCQFSAFMKNEYKGVTTARSTAVCINTYTENNVLAKEFCWFRTIDMLRGNYIGSARTGREGSVFRQEGRCKASNVKQLMSQPMTINELFILKINNSNKWIIVTDVFNLGNYFVKLYEPRPKLKYTEKELQAYRWMYFSSNNRCQQPTYFSAYELLKKRAVAVLSKSENKIVIKADYLQKVLKFYVGHYYCASDNKIIPE